MAEYQSQAGVTDQPRFAVREASRNNDEVIVIELSGQLDAHTAPDFERFLEHRVKQDEKNKLILDFHDLDYISSAGLGVLMGVIEEVRSRGGDIKLAALPERIYHVLDLLGFPLVFQIHASVDEARHAFTSGGN